MPYKDKGKLREYRRNLYQRKKEQGMQIKNNIPNILAQIPSNQLEDEIARRRRAEEDKRVSYLKMIYPNAVVL